jgi:hypothetical protein
MAAADAAKSASFIFKSNKINELLLIATTSVVVVGIVVAVVREHY